ncbi:exlusion protein FxsA [Vibrio cholerae]|nr:exlusion protein FxsA [Vibrio cholerae]TQO97640.1 exlusion protein FxsA [Vibrio cholerae]
MPTRGVSSPNEPQWFRLLCLSLVVMRCQPLRRALAIQIEFCTNNKVKI